MTNPTDYNAAVLALHVLGAVAPGKPPLDVSQLRVVLHGRAFTWSDAASELAMLVKPITCVSTWVADTLDIDVAATKPGDLFTEFATPQLIRATRGSTKDDVKIVDARAKEFICTCETLRNFDKQYNIRGRFLVTGNLPEPVDSVLGIAWVLMIRPSRSGTVVR